MALVPFKTTEKMKEARELQFCDTLLQCCAVSEVELHGAPSNTPLLYPPDTIRRVMKHTTKLLTFTRFWLFDSASSVSLKHSPSRKYYMD